MAQRHVVDTGRGESNVRLLSVPVRTLRRRRTDWSSGLVQVQGARTQRQDALPLHQRDGGVHRGWPLRTSDGLRWHTADPALLGVRSGGYTHVACHLCLLVCHRGSRVQERRGQHLHTFAGAPSAGQAAARRAGAPRWFRLRHLLRGGQPTKRLQRDRPETRLAILACMRAR